MLLLDKAQGMTSNDACKGARRLFSAAKGGHTGTLDPMATGLLPSALVRRQSSRRICWMPTRFTKPSSSWGCYRFWRCRGQVIATSPVDVSETQIDGRAAEIFRRYSASPPMHSALKRDGRPFYELARQGNRSRA